MPALEIRKHHKIDKTRRPESAILRSGNEVNGKVGRAAVPTACTLGKFPGELQQTGGLDGHAVWLFCRLQPPWTAAGRIKQYGLWNGGCGDFGLALKQEEMI